MTNILEGKPLRYLIGTDFHGRGRDGEIIEVGYDVTKPPPKGLAVAYGNLFNEKYSEQTPEQRAYYGPYLTSSDTAHEYGEGQIDPAGFGWFHNLHDQFTRRQAQGFKYIELDNPDAYALVDVLDAAKTAQNYGLDTIAKNALLVNGGAARYLSYPNVVGCIVEIDDDTPASEMPKLYSHLRQDAGRPTLPIWFVSNQDRGWALRVAHFITVNQYKNMSVTNSPNGEYTSAIDVLFPLP
jgi:hypothetical protein